MKTKIIVEILAKVSSLSKSLISKMMIQTTSGLLKMKIRTRMGIMGIIMTISPMMNIIDSHSYYQ